MFTNIVTSCACGRTSHVQLNGSHLDPLQTLILEITNTNNTRPIANKPHPCSSIPTQHPLHNIPPNNPRNPSI